jgi:hypothetical protein
MAARIDTWTLDSPGSPFAVPGWADPAGSFVEQLATVAAPDDHIVLMHDPVFGGLPWQVAIAGRWTVSYAAGWSHLVDVLDRQPSRPRKVGVALVPLAHEGAENRAALTASAGAAVRAAISADVTVERPEPMRCDRRALTDLLERPLVPRLGTPARAVSQARRAFECANDGEGDLRAHGRVQYRQVDTGLAVLREPLPAP